MTHLRAKALPPLYYITLSKNMKKIFSASDTLFLAIIAITLLDTDWYSIRPLQYISFALMALWLVLKVIYRKKD